VNTISSSRLVAVLLTSALLVLIPAAHSNPPDPTWIAGLYDDADHDDAVLAIIDGAGLVASHNLVTPRAGFSAKRLPFVNWTRPSLWSRITSVERAPPRLTSGVLSSLRRG